MELYSLQKRNLIPKIILYISNSFFRESCIKYLFSINNTWQKISKKSIVIENRKSVLRNKFDHLQAFYSSQLFHINFKSEIQSRFHKRAIRIRVAWNFLKELRRVMPTITVTTVIKVYRTSSLPHHISRALHSYGVRDIPSGVCGERETLNVSYSKGIKPLRGKRIRIIFLVYVYVASWSSPSASPQRADGSIYYSIKFVVSHRGPTPARSHLSLMT